MPAAVTLAFALPPELGDSQQLRGELRVQIAAVAAAMAAERSAPAPASWAGA